MKAIYATASLIHDIQNNEYNLPEGTIILLERYSILLQKKPVQSEELNRQACATFKIGLIACQSVVSFAVCHRS